MMEQPAENAAAQGDSAAPAAEASLGKVLREARERLGLSIADVSNQTKLASRQVEALEADDFRRLPEMPFVRGFVRSYAKILHLDAQPLLAALPQTAAPAAPLVPASVEAPFPSAHSSQRQNLIWLGMALLLSVLVVAFAVWHFTAPPAKTEAAAETPVAETTAAETPVAEAPASLPGKMQAPAVAAAGEKATAPHAKKIPAPQAETAQPSAPTEKPPVLQDEAQVPVVQPEIPLHAATLRLMFDEESWTEIRDGADTVLSSQTNPGGSELRLRGLAPFALVIGHAASVRLHYHGKPVDLEPHINPANGVARLTLE
jgi:cytoskeleton protein RodZ